jgi:sugar (pentulose or hexulose) kinase
MRIVALDVGTSSIKAAVVDVSTGQPLGAITKIPYSLDHPTQDAAEVPADRLWAVIARATHDAAQNASSIEGIGFACMTPSLVLLDKADRPVTPIWTHLDRRSRPVAQRIWTEVGEEFLATTGNRPLPGGMSVLCYLQQLAENASLQHTVRSYLHVNGWLGLKLTGERAIDPGNASFTGLYGTMTDRQWSERWCRYFGVSREWLPPVVCGSTTLGPLRPAVAEELGLPAGIPVKLGTADTSSAMLAAGMAPGDLLHVVGTTQVLAAFADNPVPRSDRLTRQLGVGHAYIHVTHNPVGGAAFGWLRDLCFRDQTDREYYEETIAKARERKSSVVLDPPFLGGDRLEIEARRAAFRELTLASDRMDLLAALMNAMRQRHHDALAALGLTGPLNRILLTGGGAEIVRRLIPEYSGDAVHLLEEGSLQGVAKLFQPRAG